MAWTVPPVAPHLVTATSARAVWTPYHRSCLGVRMRAVGQGMNVDVDVTGRDYLIMTFGWAAEPIADRWAARLAELGRPVRRWHGNELAAAQPTRPNLPLAVLRQELDRATVGFRLLAAGPQADLLAVRAVAGAAGLLDAELTDMVTDDSHRRVWCVHCTATTVAAVDASAVIRCGGCDRLLAVHHHISRRLGGYLGYQDLGPPSVAGGP